MSDSQTFRIILRSSAHPPDGSHHDRHPHHDRIIILLLTHSHDRGPPRILLMTHPPAHVVISIGFHLRGDGGSKAGGGDDAGAAEKRGGRVGPIGSADEESEGVAHVGKVDAVRDDLEGEGAGRWEYERRGKK